MDILRFGDRGPAVEYLQLALSRLGYKSGIDGNFGNETLRNVLAFQRNQGLVPDGIVGEKTWALLLPILRGYTYYTVKPGDTVYNLAKVFYTSPDAILRANPALVPTSLRVGTRIIIPYGFSLIPTNVSYTYMLYKLLVDGLRVRYPFLKVGSVGTSVMGNNLYSLKVGEGENEVFYNASHHANEWITTPVLLKFLEEYAESYARGADIFGYNAQNLYNAVTLYTVPMVNPDGIDLVNGAIDENSAFYRNALSYAQNYPQIPFPDGWKANIEGIDTNLSYPAGWDRAREIKFSQGFTSPAPRDFVGNAPLAAKESAAIYEFTRAHDFLLTLSYHTQGEVIYWQFLDYLPPNSREIGELFSSVSGYSLEATPYASSFAGYKDWFIEAFNRPGYTIEAGSGQNPLPISDFSKIYSDNIGILASGLAIFTDML